MLFLVEMVVVVVVYYPGLHTNLMADAGNYIVMTVYMTLSLFPFTVDRTFLRDTTPARCAGPGYLSKSCLHENSIFMLACTSYISWDYYYALSLPFLPLVFPPYLP